VLSLVEQSRRIGRRAYREVAPAPARADEIGDLGRAMVKMAEDLEAQEKDIAREAKHKADLSRFMAPELVDAIVKGEHSLELGGRRADVTVVFADVVAFTPLAESRPPEEAVAILNELFTILTEVVFRHEGLVDKFVGDCIMAVWGAPMDQEDHAERALRAAEDMMRFVEPAAEAWKKTHDVEIRLAIGVSSGQAIVGNVGSNKRMEYTAIGDTVNIAARLEALARPNQILVAEATKALVGEAFTFRELGKERLHGRSTDTLVYELEV
jgi:class 3 adenylate cyclase